MAIASLIIPPNLTRKLSITSSGCINCDGVLHCLTPQRMIRSTKTESWHTHKSPQLVHGGAFSVNLRALHVFRSTIKRILESRSRSSITSKFSLVMYSIHSSWYRAEVASPCQVPLVQYPSFSFCMAYLLV